MILTCGLMARAPAANASNPDLTGGNSVPPMHRAYRSCSRSPPPSRRVRRLLKGERNRRHVGTGPRSAGRDEDRLGKAGPTRRRILEFEAMAEDERVSLRAVLPEVLLELRGRGLDMADVGARGSRECAAGRGVRAAIPRLVGDGTGVSNATLKGTLRCQKRCPARRSSA